MRICLFVFCIMFFIGCAHDGCKTAETRCLDNSVQVCNTEEDWENSLNCNKMSVGGMVFLCEVDKEDGLHSCVMKDIKGDIDAGYKDGGDI